MNWDGFFLAHHDIHSNSAWYREDWKKINVKVCNSLSNPMGYVTLARFIEGKMRLRKVKQLT